MLQLRLLQLGLGSVALFLGISSGPIVNGQTYGPTAEELQRDIEEEEAALAEADAAIREEEEGRTFPAVADYRQRSGLITRYTPLQSSLPVDRDRNLWLGNRYEPRKPHRRGKHVNSWKDGGLYGLPLPAACTRCVSPYFRGTPGASTVTPKCKRPTFLGRLIGNFVHPFKPVDSYYDGGCYVPIYDLDPVVPGPGPFPFPFFAPKPTGN